MPNEVKVSRKLFISCILILSIIFIGIIIAQREYYETKLNEVTKNVEVNNQEPPLRIIE